MQQQDHSPRSALRIHDVAEQLGISYKAAYGLTKTRLKYFQVCKAGTIYVDRASFAQFMEDSFGDDAL